MRSSLYVVPALVMVAIGGAASLQVTSMKAKPARSAPASPVQNRCGWIVNPTPANWWLIDRDGEWTLGAQGGYQAPGLDNLPDLTEKDWVVTNGSSYGYGCGCMRVSVDRRSGRVLRVHHFEQKPLRLCRADRKLGKPD